MSRFKDLTGCRFDKLTVIGFDGHKQNSKNSNYYWLCKCKCGSIVSVRGDHLRNGGTRSCGCASIEMRKQTRKAKASLKKSRTYKYSQEGTESASQTPDDILWGDIPAPKYEILFSDLFFLLTGERL